MTTTTTCTASTDQPRRRGRPKGSTGISCRRRPLTPSRILLTPDQAGELAGVSGQTWNIHAKKNIPGFPQAREWPPGSGQSRFVRDEVVEYLKNLPTLHPS